MKLYFSEHDEDVCKCISSHLKYMQENGLSELKVFEAKVEHGTGYFFCKEFQEVGEVNGTCGKTCDKYEPRNKKSGICKHYGYVYEQTEKFKILKLKINDSTQQ